MVSGHPCALDANRRTVTGMIGSATLLLGDARAIPLGSETVDLALTSPPFYNKRSYKDAGEHMPGQLGNEDAPEEYLEDLVAITREMARVLKPSGSIFVNLDDSPGYSGQGGNGSLPHVGSSDGAVRRANMPVARRIPGRPRKGLLLLPERYLIACADQLGLIVRSTIVWDKVNSMPESVKDRVRRSHEVWFHLTKRQHYYADLDPIREPHSNESIKRAAAHPAPTGRGYDGTRVDPGDSLHPFGRLPGSVWSISTEPLRLPDQFSEDERHYAAMPTEWPRRLILAFSPPGGVVLDPFGGTGTTAAVAKALGRHGISVELSNDYQRIARWRTSGAGFCAVQRKVNGSIEQSADGSTQLALL